jgi:hypothetical protein
VCFSDLVKAHLSAAKKVSPHPDKSCSQKSIKVDEDTSLAVFRIRMLLALLEPHPDPLVTSTDPVPSIIKQK